jgi:cation transport protein ChaC
MDKTFGYLGMVLSCGNLGLNMHSKRLEDCKTTKGLFVCGQFIIEEHQRIRGLVLALDKVQGAVCEGLLFRVRAKNVDKVLAYLRKRELISEAYLEVIIDVELVSGEIVKAYTYIVNRQHEQYAGSLTIEDQAIIINSAKGSIGPKQ